jgi:uncharacterized cysteine cluster protein YcgN (CxxCxxCC family)
MTKLTKGEVDGLCDGGGLCEYLKLESQVADAADMPRLRV